MNMQTGELHEDIKSEIMDKLVKPITENEFKAMSTIFPPERRPLELIWIRHREEILKLETRKEAFLAGYEAGKVAKDME